MTTADAKPTPSIKHDMRTIYRDGVAVAHIVNRPNGKYGLSNLLGRRLTNRAFDTRIEAFHHYRDHIA